MANTLEPGRVRVGHIMDGSETGGEPIQSATLTFDDKYGAELHIAYLLDVPDKPSPQFSRANTWFRRSGEGLPKTLLFFDESGVVTLNGLLRSHLSHGTWPLARVRANVAIFGQPRNVRSDFPVHELLSTIDGLEEFTRFEPVSHDEQLLDDGRVRTTVAVENTESVEWVANGYSYAIKSNVSWTAQHGRYFRVVDSDPYILTKHEHGASPLDHLAAQWPIRALLILIHGQPLSWRSHRLRDDEFPLWMMAGPPRDPEFVEVQFSGTIAQQRAERPTSPHFSHAPLTIGSVSPAGLANWTLLYDTDVFRQAVEPAVEVLNGATRFLEPQLMMLAISLDRLGYFRFGDRRRRPMAENIEKCMDAADIDWPSIGTRKGIAAAIAKVNNDLKHPDREATPTARELSGIVSLAKIIVRAQVYDLLEARAKDREDFVLRGNDALNALNMFTSVQLTVDDSGHFVAAS